MALASRGPVFGGMVLSICASVFALVLIGCATNTPASAPVTPSVPNTAATSPTSPSATAFGCISRDQVMTYLAAISDHLAQAIPTVSTLDEQLRVADELSQIASDTRVIRYAVEARRPDIASKLAVANQSFAEAALAMATGQVGEAGTLLEAGTTALGALDNLRREDYCE